MRSKKRLSTVLCGILCVCMMFAVIGCDDKENNAPIESEDTAPVLVIEQKDAFGAGRYVVREEMQIPKASAFDNEDGDLGAKIQLQVYFARAGENVLIDGESDKVKGNKVTYFTPTKCGNYKAIYMVRDSGGNIVKEEVPFTVVASGEEREWHLLSETERENWVLGNGARFDDEGNIALADRGDTSVAYKGHKLESGDLVQMRFNATQGAQRRYMSFGGFLSRSHLADAPAANEAKTTSGYLYICIVDGYYEIWSCREGGQEKKLDQRSLNLVDGKDHTVAYRATLHADGADSYVLFQVWIDEDVTEDAFEEKIYAAELRAPYEAAGKAAFDAIFTDATKEQYTKAEVKTAIGEDEFAATFADMFPAESDDTATIETSELQSKYVEKYADKEFGKIYGDMFDEEKFGGWVFVGASHGDAKIQVKSLGINGKQSVDAPVLTVEFEKETAHVVNEEITFPQPKKAEDGNDYSDLSARVKLTVVKKEQGGTSAVRTELPGYTFTPTEIGFYTVIYTVTDYSGNKSFAYHDFSVSKTDHDAPPVLVLSSTADIAAKAGEAVTLPTVVSALDPDGNDFADLVTVELIGPEAQVLTTGTHIFYTAGEHTVRYGVTDYTGKETYQDIKVTVTADNDWLLGMETEDFNSNIEREYDASGKTSAMLLYDGYSAGYRKQKIYGEKVSVLLDATFATAWNSGDGLNFIQFALRGDKFADLDAGEDGFVFDKFDWLTGLFVEVNIVDGFAVYGGKRDSGELFKVSPNKSLRELFDGETVFSWQVTDVYTGTRLTGIEIRMWINDEPIRLDPDNNSDVYTISGRKLQPHMSKSGWLSFYANGKGKSYDPTRILGVTIDGSTPQVLVAEVPDTVVKKTGAGKMYSLPAIVATFGHEVIPERDISVYTVPYGEDALGVAKHIGDEFTVDEDYYAGFTVRYYYRGRCIASYFVTVEFVISGVVFDIDTGDLRATTGEAFTVPQIVSYDIGQQTLTDTSKINVKLVYDADIARKPIEITGNTYTPLERKSFTLQYYYGELKIEELTVYVAGGGDIDNVLQDTHFVGIGNTSVAEGVLHQKPGLGVGYAYTGEQFYDEKITLTTEFNFGTAWGASNGTWTYVINLRGDNHTGESLGTAPKIMAVNDGSNNGLYLYMQAEEGIYLAYGHRLSKLATYNPATGVMSNQSGTVKAGAHWEQTYMPAGTKLSWQVTDEFEGGVATGVRVKVWLKTPTDAAEKLIIDCPVSAQDRPDVFDSYFLVAENFGVPKSDEIASKITGIRVERTAQAKESEYTVEFDATEEELVGVRGKKFTVPAVTVKHDGTAVTDVAAEIYFVRGKVSEKVSVGQQIDIAKSETAESFVLRVTYRGLVIENREVLIVNDARVLAWDADPVRTATVGTAYTVAQPTRVRVEDVTTDIDETHPVVAELVYDGAARKKITVGGTYTPLEKKDFSICYYYDGVLVETVKVAMNGAGDVANLLDGIQAGTYQYRVKDAEKNNENATVPASGIELHGFNGNTFIYKERQFYDEKITLTLDLALAAAWQGTDGATLFNINLRGQKTEGNSFTDWPFMFNGIDGTGCGLWLCIQANEGIYLKYGPRGTGTQIAYNPKDGGNTANAGAHWEQTCMPAGTQLSWQVTDVFDGKAEPIGVRVKVWLKKPADTVEKKVIDCFVNATDRPELFESYYLITETANGYGGGGDGESGATKITGIRVTSSTATAYEDIAQNLLIDAAAGDWKTTGYGAVVGNAMSIRSGVGCSVAYIKETLYDEKVTVALDAHFATAYNGSGIWMAAFNLRGDNTSGDSLGAGGSILNNSNGENSGLWLCLQSGEGFRLCYGNRDSGVIARFNPATGGNTGVAGAYWEETYMPAGTLLSWQVTDVLGEDNTTKTGVRVRVWLQAPGQAEVQVFDETISADGKTGLFDRYNFYAEVFGTSNNEHGYMNISALHIEQAA